MLLGVVAPGGQYLPAVAVHTYEHATELDLAPRVYPAVPAGQRVHPDALPPVLLYWPAGQASPVSVVAPTGQYLPAFAVQAPVQSEEFAVEDELPNRPAGQRIHSLAVPAAA